MSDFKPYVQRLVDSACDIDDLLSDGEAIDMRFVHDGGTLYMLWRKSDGDEISISMVHFDDGLGASECKVRTVSFIGDECLSQLRDFLGMKGGES